MQLLHTKHFPTRQNPGVVRGSPNTFLLQVLPLLVLAVLTASANHALAMPGHGRMVAGGVLHRSVYAAFPTMLRGILQDAF